MLVAHQAKLQSIKTRDQDRLNGIQPHTLTAEIDASSFTFKALEAGRAGRAGPADPAGPQESVSRKIQIKPDINVTVGTKELSALEFFRSIGCLVDGDRIDMFKLNKIKQYLDMIKDGTSSNLLKKLKIFEFTEDPNVIPNVTYPNTLDAIKEYFNKHYTKEGKLSSVFWPRHGEYSFYLGNDEIALHDCGFKPNVCILKGPSDYIDPLAHGSINLLIDLIFPKGKSTIEWTSEMLQTIGYPPGCSIKITNNAALAQDHVWDIEMVCQNSEQRTPLNVKIDERGIYKANGKGQLNQPIKINGVENLTQMTQGNAFKKLIQQSAAADNVISLEMKLILLGLILIKSFGDNSFDITQRELLLYRFLTTIFTCDFTLFLSVITSGMMRSSAVLTTNTRPTLGGPTGNLSTRFTPIDLTPKQELDATFESCMFENYQYLRMLVNLYTTEREKPGIPGITIKVGSENKTVHLWFLATIIKAIQNNMVRHIHIFTQFVSLLPPEPTPHWKNNKENVLQLLKSYCKIVFPFVKKNGIWTVFAQMGLTSNFPLFRDVYVNSFVTHCHAHIEANKDSLKVAINACLTVFGESTKVHVSIGKINAQQYACLIGKHFIDTVKLTAKTIMDAKLPDISERQCQMFDPTRADSRLKDTGVAGEAAITDAMIRFNTSASTRAGAGAAVPAALDAEPGAAVPAALDAEPGAAAAPDAANAAVPAELLAAEPGAVSGDAAVPTGLPAYGNAALLNVVSPKGRRPKIGGVGSRSRSRSPSPSPRSRNRRPMSRNRSPTSRNRSPTSRNRTSQTRRARGLSPSRYRSREQPVPELLNDIEQTFDNYIDSVRESDRESVQADPLNVIFAGFPPETLSGRLASTIEQHIREQLENFKFIVAIMLYTYLSQLMILINIQITNKIATMIDSASGQTAPVPEADESKAHVTRCSEITDQFKKLIHKANSLNRDINFGRKDDINFGSKDDMKFLKCIQRLINRNPNVFDFEVVEKVEEIITKVKATLTTKKINPSMDTIEYAISCLNFDIFYCCLGNVYKLDSYKKFYHDLRKSHEGYETKEYIPELHTGLTSSSQPDMEAHHSFFLYFYENIHNIAYNVFYNHEYQLPTVCRDFDQMVKHLKKETGIQQVNVQELTKRVRAVENPFDSPLEFSSGDSIGYSSSESSKSSIRPFKLKSVFVGPDSTGVRGYDSVGGSPRTRRQRKKQTKRTRRLRFHNRKRTCKKSNK